MKLNWTGERPSALPATAAFCGPRVSGVARAAFFSSVVLASNASAVPGRSASTASLVEHPVVARPRAAGGALRVSALPDPTPVSKARKRNGLDDSGIQATTVQKFASKQIGVMPVYRVTGVGGVPPRGRPN